MFTTPKAIENAATGAEDMRKLLERAWSGDESTLPALRLLLNNRKNVDVLGGNLAEHAEWVFVKNAAGNNLPFREAVLHKLELMRADLAGPNPTPVERLLVERVIACWLQVQDADVRYAQSRKNPTIAWSEHHQRRMDRAHNRYLSAIKTLATVRKLAVPVLQVNITAAAQAREAEARVRLVEPPEAERAPTWVRPLQ